jgi:DNA-directed RNA polymerase subunit RPC12/RpoP
MCYSPTKKETTMERTLEEKIRDRHPLAVNEQGEFLASFWSIKDLQQMGRLSEAALGQLLSFGERGQYKCIECSSTEEHVPSAELREDRDCAKCGSPLLRVTGGFAPLNPRKVQRHTGDFLIRYFRPFYELKGGIPHDCIRGTEVHFILKDGTILRDAVETICLNALPEYEDDAAQSDGPEWNKGETVREAMDKLPEKDQVAYIVREDLYNNACIGAGEDYCEVYIYEIP